MTVELLQTLSLVSYIVAGILFLIAVALFFLLDIIKIYGDLSGRTAKKAIEEIRKQNESSGNKAYKPSPVNAKRGKLTDKITPSGKLKSQTDAHLISVGTEKISPLNIVSNANETTVLSNLSSETTILKENPVSVSGETELLVDIEQQFSRVSEGREFDIDIELSFTGSSEIIE